MWLGADADLRKAVQLESDPDHKTLYRFLARLKPGDRERVEAALAASRLPNAYATGDRHRTLLQLPWGDVRFGVLFPGTITTTYLPAAD